MKIAKLNIELVWQKRGGTCSSYIHKIAHAHLLCSNHEYELEIDVGPAKYFPLRSWDELEQMLSYDLEEVYFTVLDLETPPITTEVIENELVKEFLHHHLHDLYKFPLHPLSSYTIFYCEMEHNEEEKMHDVMNFPFYFFRVKQHLDPHDIFLCEKISFVQYMKSEKYSLERWCSPPTDAFESLHLFMKVSRARQIKHFSAGTSPSHNKNDDILMCAWLYDIPVIRIY